MPLMPLEISSSAPFPTAQYTAIPPVSSEENSLYADPTPHIPSKYSQYVFALNSNGNLCSITEFINSAAEEHQIASARWSGSSTEFQISQTHGHNSNSNLAFLLDDSEHCAISIYQFPSETGIPYIPIEVQFTTDAGTVTTKGKSKAETVNSQSMDDISWSIVPSSSADSHTSPEVALMRDPHLPTDSDTVNLMHPETSEGPKDFKEMSIPRKFMKPTKRTPKSDLASRRTSATSSVVGIRTPSSDRLAHTPRIRAKIPTQPAPIDMGPVSNGHTPEALPHQGKNGNIPARLEIPSVTPSKPSLLHNGFPPLPSFRTTHALAAEAGANTPAFPSTMISGLRANTAGPSATFQQKHVVDETHESSNEALASDMPTLKECI
jgi:hypothetical protein